MLLRRNLSSARFAVNGEDQCNFCGDRPSRHHGRCCEHNPYNRYPPSGDDYPTPPTPTPVVWHVSRHHSNDDVEFADVDMRGKRKRTIEESEVEEVPVVQAMDNWVQSTKPRGATQLFDEEARSDDSTATQCEGQGRINFTGRRVLIDYSSKKIWEAALEHPTCSSCGE